MVDTHPGLTPELHIRFDTTSIIIASQLAEILAAISRDYNLFTRGRTLTVRDLQIGSLDIWINDALTIGNHLASAAAPYARNGVEIAKGGKALLDFTKALGDNFRKTKSSEASAQLPRGRKGIGLRTVRSIAKVAVETNSIVEINSSDSLGNYQEIKVTPLEAQHINNNLRPTSGEEPRPTIAKALTSALPRMEDSDASYRSSYVDSLLALKDMSQDQKAVIVEALVSSLNSQGLSSSIRTLASELDVRGQYELAMLLRNAGGGSDTDRGSTLTLR